LFKEAGAAAFFKAALHELFEEPVSLDNFITQQKISISDLKRKSIFFLSERSLKESDTSFTNDTGRIS
jgi:hypothetical protein